MTQNHGGNFNCAESQSTEVNVCSLIADIERNAVINHTIDEAAKNIELILVSLIVNNNYEILP